MDAVRRAAVAGGAESAGLPARRHGLQCRQMVRNVYFIGMVDVFDHRAQRIGGPKEHVGDRRSGASCRLRTRLRTVSSAWANSSMREN